jgi:hypothetical protein
MTSDQVFHPGLWYLLLTFLALSLPLFVFILWKSKRWAIMYLVLVIALGIYLAFFSARNFGGAFGAGMAIACLSVFLVPISLILWILLRRPFRHRFKEDHTRQRLFAIGAVVIVFVQLLPFLGSYSINAACFSATQNSAETLIATAQAYYLDHGRYPTDVAELVHLMTEDYPTPACSWLSGQKYRQQTGFEFTECPDEQVLLTSYSMDGTSIERYNFATGNWSAISFLDGACSHLR